MGPFFLLQNYTGQISSFNPDSGQVPQKLKKLEEMHI